jgi:flagellar basal-body rod modification protein FlgD
MDIANTIANAAAQGASMNAPSGGSLQSKDSDRPSTDPQFGDVLSKIQSQYGAKADKPREIKKTLGKDDFLKIMITQMQHQDPTNPFKAEQMAQEMAQFTSVEQMQNMNSSLKQMAQQHNPLEKLAMTNLIGKTVTVDRDRFPHSEGENESLSFKKISARKRAAKILSRGMASRKTTCPRRAETTCSGSRPRTTATRRSRWIRSIRPKWWA